MFLLFFFIFCVCVFVSQIQLYVKYIYLYKHRGYSKRDIHSLETRSEMKLFFTNIGKLVNWNKPESVVFVVDGFV